MRALHAAVSLSLALGCTIPPSRSSTELSTRDMRLSVLLEGESTGTKVRASLVGPFGDFDLEGGDTFSLYAAGQPFALSSDGHGTFVAEAPARSGDFVFDLVRPADRGARVTLSMPPDTDLVADPPTARVVPVRWTPSDGAFATTLDTEGTCIAGGSVTPTRDTGAYLIDVAALGPKGGGCTLTVTLTRVASGSAYLLGEPWMTYTARLTRRVAVAWSPG
jgi:hypothetical protein